MIVFKTEMKNMPPTCNYCNFRHICKPELNLSPRDTKQIVPFLEYCPLVEIPDPKPEPTLTQHEHDLIQIIKKVYPEAVSIGIARNENIINVVLDRTLTTLSTDLFKREYKCMQTIPLELFDKYKLPTLLSEFTQQTYAIQYPIEKLLSMPIKG